MFCCCRPYASGEVTVQPYNTLLSMAALAEGSSGMLLLQNEALHATCTRLLGIKHPGFKVRWGVICLSGTLDLACCCCRMRRCMPHVHGCWASSTQGSR
jgi:hypothetical protein